MKSPDKKPELPPLMALPGKHERCFFHIRQTCNNPLLNPSPHNKKDGTLFSAFSVEFEFCLQVKGIEMQELEICIKLLYYLNTFIQTVNV